jgi:hypothetical protein
MPNRLNDFDAGFEGEPFNWTNVYGGGATFSTVRSCDPSVTPPQGNCYMRSEYTGGAWGPLIIESPFVPVDSSLDTFHGKFSAVAGARTVIGYLYLRFYDAGFTVLGDAWAVGGAATVVAHYPGWTQITWDPADPWPPDAVLPHPSAVWAKLVVEVYCTTNWVAGDRIYHDEFWVEGSGEDVCPPRLQATANVGTLRLRPHHKD